MAYSLGVDTSEEGVTSRRIDPRGFTTSHGAGQISSLIPRVNCYGQAPADGEIKQKVLGQLSAGLSMKARPNEI